MWGTILVFVGFVLLLENFGIITFYWRNVWSLWPVFLIIAGANILFNRKGSETGQRICLGILGVVLVIIFFKGQQPPSGSGWVGDRITRNLDREMNEDQGDTAQRLSFAEPVVPEDSTKKVVLNITGGGTSFHLNGETDQLFLADVSRRGGTFLLERTNSDSVTTLNFRMKKKKNGISFNAGGNDVGMKLNRAPEWNLNMNMGVGEVNLDFKAYKLRSFSFDGGAAALNLTVGQLLPLTELSVKTGVADVKIQVPEASGCMIRTKTGLSAKDFPGFVKIDDNNYETAEYKTAAKKVMIQLDGGLSNFEVSRY